MSILSSVSSTFTIKISVCVRLIFDFDLYKQTLSASKYFCCLRHATHHFAIHDFTQKKLLHPMPELSNSPYGSYRLTTKNNFTNFKPQLTHIATLH